MSAATKQGAQSDRADTRGWLRYLDIHANLESKKMR